MPTYRQDKSVVVPVESYRTLIDLQMFVQTGTGTRGESIGGFKTVYPQVPANVISLSGRELELARQLVPLASHRVSLRYISGISVVNWQIYLPDTKEVLKIGNLNDVDYRSRNLILVCYSESNVS